MPLSSDFLRLVIEHLNVGLVVTDRRNNIVLFNRQAGEMLQEDPKERTGSTVLSCHPRESDRVVEKLIEDIKSGAIDHYEGWADFRGRILYEYILPIRNGEGGFEGMIEELHDAASQADLLRRLGEWKDVHVAGEGVRAPRKPEYDQRSVGSLDHIQNERFTD